MISKKYRSELALLLVTILWGGTFTIIKESLNDISSMLFIAFRMSGAVLLLLPFLFKYRQELKWKPILAGIILGFLMFASFATQTFGLKYTTATKSGFLTGSAVVMIPILQILIEKKKPAIGSVIGVILVFVGILFLSSGGNSITTFLNDIGTSFNFGDGLTVLCAVMVALHVIYLDVYTKIFSLFVLMFFQIFTSALLGFFFAGLFAITSVEPIHIHLTEYLILGLIYISVFATLITFGLQTRFQKDVTPTKAGIIYAFEPIFAAVIAFFALNEKITNFGFVGCVLIFSGLIFSEVYDNFFKSKLNENSAG